MIKTKNEIKFRDEEEIEKTNKNNKSLLAYSFLNIYYKENVLWRKWVFFFLILYISW